MTQAKRLLEFPCLFPIKVMGKAQPDFEIAVLTIVRRHIPHLSENAISQRYSKDKHFLSLTLQIQAESQAMLDDLYRELTAHPLVLMVL